MSLQTLLDAAQFLECDNSVKEQSSNSHEISNKGKTTSSSNSKLARDHSDAPNSPTDEVGPFHCQGVHIHATAYETDTRKPLGTDINSTSGTSRNFPYPVSTNAALSTNQLLPRKDCDNKQSQQFYQPNGSEQHLKLPQQKIRAEQSVILPSANASEPASSMSTYVNDPPQSSHMHPLLARARAAVENASFSEEKSDSPSVNRIPSNTNALNPKYMLNNVTSAQVVSLHSAANKQLLTIDSNNLYGSASPNGPHNPQWGSLNASAVPFSNAPFSSSQLNSSMPVAVNGPMTGSQPHMDLNILLPSLVKTSEDEKVFAALQFKQVKRAVTLTHNQLEKNRRAHLKECFEALKASIPRLGMRRSSNLTILKAALRHVQILKRKSADYQRSVVELKKDEAAKTERIAALMKELTEVADQQTVEKYLEAAAKKDLSLMMTGGNSTVSNSLLDEDQQSTSTASEAEEEELRASLVIDEMPKQNSQAPQSQNSIEKQQQQLYKRQQDIQNSDEHRQSAEERRRVEKPQDTVHQQTVQVRRVEAQIMAQQRDCHQKYEVPHASDGNGAPSYKIPRSHALHLTLPQAPSSEVANLLNKNAYRPTPRKSPIKLYGQPSGRSATPSPPSNIVPFFPRFSIGSGGSPPLLTSPNFDPIELSATYGLSKNNVKKLNNGALFGSDIKELAAYNAGEKQTNASKPPNATLAAAAANASCASTAPSARVSNPPSHAAVDPVNPAVNLASTTHINPLSLPNFPGFQVKVKCISTAGDSATTAAAPSTDQTHIPMKKRHFDVSTFSPARVVQSAARPKPVPSPRNDSELQMTSLYVGASPSLLGLSSRNSATSTSDNESDRDSPFRDHKRNKLHHPHWRKSLVNDRPGKEWMEYRNKIAEKPGRKKTYLLHQYEAPQTKVIANTSNKMNTDVKPRATFSLWDRKHHAITMTTATNWRGKQQQQLIASKPKSSLTSSPAVSPQAAVQTSHNSVTQVCYTTLQKASKPTVPNCLLVRKTVAQSPQVVATEPQYTAPKTAQVAPVPAKPQTVVKVIPTSQTLETNGFVQLANPGVQQVHTLPVNLPGNQIAYQIVQAPISASPAPGSNYKPTPATSLPPDTVVRTVASHLLGSPMVNYVTMNNVGMLGSSGMEPVGPNQASPATAVAKSAQPAVVAPANPVQMPQMPFVIPVGYGYVMYPGNIAGAVPHNGLQVADISQNTKLVAPSDLVAMQTVQVQQPPTMQIRVGTKRPVSPSTPGKPPSRNQSTDSASSSTLSVDSADIDGDKRSRVVVPKKRRYSNQQQENENAVTPPSSTQHVTTQVPRANLPQAQFVLPGNSGFVMASPASGNGYSIPINLVSYPFQAYPGAGNAGCIQAVQMAGLPTAQAIRNVGQIWPMNPTIVPISADSPDSSVAVATSSSGVQRTNSSSVALQKVNNVGPS